MKRLLIFVVRAVFVTSLVAGVFALVVTEFSRSPARSPIQSGLLLAFIVEVVACLSILLSTLCLVFQKRIVDFLYREGEEEKGGGQTLVPWIKLLGIALALFSVSNILTISETFTWGRTTSEGTMAQTQSASTTYSFNVFAVGVAFLGFWISRRANRLHQKFFQEKDQ